MILNSTQVSSLCIEQIFKSGETDPLSDDDAHSAEKKCIGLAFKACK